MLISYKIKQIDITNPKTADALKVAFMPFEIASNKANIKDLMKTEYETVYESTLDTKNYIIDAHNILEELFRIFNIDHPADFKGHSLSVSDIVILNINGKTSSWYCNDMGWTEIK